MKTRTLLCSLAIASLGFASLAQAQPHGGRDGRHDAREARHERGPHHRAGKEARRDHHDHRDARHDRRHDRHDRHDARHDRREARHYYNARSPEFRRGGRLPHAVRHTHYVVNDWRGHRLAPPPRGHHWVQVGPDYVLAAVATGLIVNLVLSQ